MKSMFSFDNISNNQYAAFVISTLVIFMIVIACAAWYYIKMKIFVNRAFSSERLSMEIVEIKRLYEKKQSALQQFPALYSYVQGINPLFEKYIIDFRKAKIIRYDQPKEELRRFREEYRQASTNIQELVQRYADLLRRIYRTNHPIRFLLNSFQINAKIYYTLFRFIIGFAVSSGFRLLFSFTFSQHRKRLVYEKNLQSITENSEIIIADMSYAA